MTLKTFTSKIILILTWTLVGFSGFNNCAAQSIVGKWNQISSKQFLTAEGSKTHGKSVLETQMASIGTVTFEFKSDHTYIEKTSHAGDSTCAYIYRDMVLIGKSVGIETGSKTRGSEV